MSNKNIIVNKFGGTSVGSIERIQAVADRLVDMAKAGNSVVTVVSAMGKSTDQLVEMANEISNGTPDSREYDALISTGENISAALLSMALITRGVPAISLNGRQAGIKTEAIFSKAKITNVDNARIHSELNDGKIVIITGFQGYTDCDNITTIGRGGSDTSAVVLAAALGAKECQIYTDVDGVYTTDPRICKDAQKLEAVSCDEMLELASLGAGVLHPRAVECAKEHGITLHVRSSFNTNTGTRVKEMKTMETNHAVTGVAVAKDEAKLSIYRIPDQPNIAAQIFESLGKAHINVDMIVQSSSQNGLNDITFTVTRGDVKKAQDILSTLVSGLDASGISSNEHVAKVSIVGVGMISRPGIAAQMFRVLGENNINIDLISTSEIKVSCVVPVEQAELAVQKLHQAFITDAQPVLSE